MTHREFDWRMAKATGAAGPEAVWLTVAGHTWEFRGVARELREELERRWGPFAVNRPGSVVSQVDVLDAGSGPWLPHEEGPKLLRLESVPDTHPPAVVSHSFGMILREDGSASIGLERSPRETVPRVVENAARVLVARQVVACGGMAFHGGGIIRRDGAWIFVGPSRAGKSTIIGLAAPCRPLGDDFAAIVRRDGRWHAAAVPFDNAERIDEDRPTGTVKLEAIYRLFQASSVAVERSRGPAAVASLLSCAAFPWLLPDLAESMAHTASLLVEDGRFAHLRFSRDKAFWPALDADRRHT